MKQFTEEEIFGKKLPEGTKYPADRENAPTPLRLVTKERVGKRENLAKVDALKLHNIVRPKKATLPILELFRAQGGQLMTTDLERYVLTPTDLKDGIYQQIGKELFLVKGEKVEDFPAIPSSSGGDYPSFRVDGEVLAMLDEATEFVSTDELRPAMCAVLLTNTDLVASNGHVLYHRSVGLGKKFTTLVDPVIVKLMKAIKRDSFYVELRTADATKTKYLVATTDGAQFIQRVADDHYPNYPSVIPTDCTARITCETFDLQEQVKYVKQFAGALRGIRNKGYSYPVTFTLNRKDSTLGISAEDIDKGVKTNKSIKCKIEAWTAKGQKIPNGNLALVMPQRIADNTDDNMFRIDAEYLLTCIGTSGTTVSLYYSSPTRALIIQ